MQKILGLDIGSYSVKAVEIVNTFKTYKVTGFYEKVIPEIQGVDPSLLGMTAVRQLLAENELEADRIFTSMTGMHVSARILQLQNVKKKNIPTIVQGELEEQSPFDIDELVIDQQILDTRDNTTSILAVMARKDYVEAYLSGLKELEIEPKIIDVDFLTFLNLKPFLDFEGTLASEVSDGTQKTRKTNDNSPLIVDIGHSKTSVVLFQNGKLAAVRTIPMGGRYFTEYLAKSLAISFDEAQRLKHAVSRLEYDPDAAPTPGNEREFIVARKLAVAVAELLKELVRTLYAFRSHDKLHVDNILLTGGSTQIQNLGGYLEEFLEVPVRRMTFEMSRLKIEDDLVPTLQHLAQPLAIALRGISHKEQSRINLRRGELAFVGSYDTIVRQTFNISALVASLLVCLIASYGLRWWLYGQQIESFHKDFRAQVTQILGQEPQQLKNLHNKGDYKSYAATALRIINGELANREAVVETFSRSRSTIPLNVLNEISRVIPKDTPLEIVDFKVEGNIFTLDAETDSLTTSEKIIEMLRTVSLLEKVEVKDRGAKPGSDNKILKMKLSAVVKEGV